MGAPSPKKRKLSAKELANLQPNPQYLKRGGKKPRTILTPAEIEFCSHIAAGATGADAVRWAGIDTQYPGQTAWTYQRHPTFQAKIEELRGKLSVEAEDRATKRRDERAEFIHREFIHRLRTAKTHDIKGDDAIAKMLEIGFKSTREIESTRIIANAGANANVNNASIDVYKPAWLREKEAQLVVEARERMKLPPTP